ncbi:MAG: PKD domain-containing protein [Phaeodactylibacter sp.]|uniref:PKD domain-containing protein n=1 Tax=Phaeodactylibacter sp. TaxID=1940289 RepID=UPI0032EC8415
MQKHLLILLLFNLTVFILEGQSVLQFQPLEATSSKILDGQFSDYQLGKAPVAALQQRLQSAGGREVHLTLKLGQMEAFELLVAAHDLRAPDYQLIVAEPGGKRQLPVGENKTYRGHSLHAEADQARLTVDKNFLYGFIEWEAETYFIEPAWLLDATLAEGTYVWYEEGALKAPETPHTCGTEHDHSFKPGPAPQLGRQMMQCYSVGMGLAADFQLFNALGSATAVENFMLGVLNNVGTNYDDEFANQIEFIVNGTFISSCSSCDPWTGSNNASSLLNSFTNWGNGGGFGFNHSLATLWTDRNFDGSTIGVAWLGGLCTSDRYNTCERFSSNAAVLRVLQAHEIGHNFNAFHDGGNSNTIMAPSVNTSNNWSNTSINTINNYINAQSGVPGCFGACGSPIAPPVAEIGTPVEEACPGSFIQFIDESQNSPTSWSWSFTGGVPNSSSQQHPVVFYPNPGIYTATLNATNSAGSSFTVSNTIIVQEGNTKYLFYDAMEGNLNNWTVENPDNGTTWTITNIGGAQFGQQAAYMNNYNYDAEGQRDALITPILNFSAEAGMRLKIDYAYQRYSLALTDELRVLVSTNGGNTYPDEIFFGEENGSGNFATTPDGTDLFNPSVPADWCFAGNFGANCLDIDLSAYAGEPEVRIKIENTNGFGNNLYIDNVQVVSNCFVLQPPTAAFAADVEMGCAPLTVQYTDFSLGDIDTWQWSFPGGVPASSNQQNPTVEYPVPGEYPVTLTVSNAAGSSTTSLNTDIEVQGPPEPFFLYDIDSFTVAFGNLTENYTGVKWEFGDGNETEDDSPTHTYAEPGTYTVRLSAQNACGMAEYTEDITIVPPPTASFHSESLSGCAPVLMQFINTSSFGETFHWTFENGNPATSTDPDPICSFAESGTYEVTLIATNSIGSDTLTQMITVSGGPQSSFFADYLPGSFTVSFQNTSLEAFAFEWDFGDGSPVNTDFFPTHTYDTTGVYTVTLIATNDCGSDTATQTVTIVQPPTAGFSIPLDTSCAPYTVMPTNTSQGVVDSWLWIATGASPDTATVADPTFTFDSAGTYEIILQATNTAGTSFDTSTLVIGGLPASAFVVDDTLGSPQIATVNNSTNADHYTWFFGDGNTSGAAEPVHTYAQDGDYTVTLVTENSCGTDTLEQMITIVTPPVAAIGNADTSGCSVFVLEPSYEGSANADTLLWSAPGSVELTSDTAAPTFTYEVPGDYLLIVSASNAAGSSSDTLLVTVGGPPTADFGLSYTTGDDTIAVSSQSIAVDSLLWDFGDGDTSTEASATHQYDEDGTYTVQLIVWNSCGTDTMEQTVDILTLPVAGFALNAATGCAPFTVQIQPANPDADYNYVYTANGAQPSVSSVADPTFTFASPGTYSIIQKVTNPAGSSSDTLQVTVGASPDAAFNASVTPGNLDLDLINNSEDAATYSWDFGDGNMSTEASPQHTYTEDGSYTVQLVASSTCGADTAQQVVEVVTAPVAGFSLDAANGCVPFTVSVSSTASANATAVSYEAPGATPNGSTSPNPVFTYTAAGTYQIVQTVTNAAGSSNDTLQVTVGDAPAAGFEANTTLGSLDLSLIDNSTGASGYAWSFGDGNSSTEPLPTHTYATDGLYTIQLIVSNDCGSDTTAREVEAVTAPTAGFATESTEGCAPFTVNLSSTASANAASFTYTATGAVPPVSSDPNPAFTFPSAGSYTIIQQVSNAAGSSTDTLAILVGDVPDAGFEGAVVPGSTLLEVENNTLGATSYDWDFGDGNGSTEAEPTHTYTMDGAYTVTLIAANNCGADTVAQQIFVITAPTAEILSDTVKGCLPFTVTPVSVASANATALSWTAPGASPETATGMMPEFLYTTAGTYTIYLEASNAAGVSIDSATVEVLDVPDAAFTASTDGFTVTFDNASTGAFDYSWDFGDGNSSTDADLVYTYSAPGDYPVTLTATNDCGQADTTVMVTITVPPPAAGFEVESTSGCAPFEVAFTNTSQFGESFEWQFSGGTPATSTDENPVVAYEEAGVYSVTLIAANASGTDTIELPGLITVEAAPQANFGYTIDQATVNFTNTALNADTFLWLFGDGSSSTAVNPVYNYGAAGSFEVALIAGNDCGVDTLQQSIEIVGQAPEATISFGNPAGACAPLTLQLYASSPEGAPAEAWQWLLPGGAPETAAGDTVTVTYNDAGTYSITLIGTNAFGADTLILLDTLNLQEPPVAGFTYVAEEGDVTFTSVSEGTNLSFEWDFGDGTTSTDPNPMYSYDMTGQYTVSLTVANACDTVTFSEVLDIMITSTGEWVDLEAFNVFPNPTGGRFTVQVVAPPSKHLHCQLYNLIGQQLKDYQSDFQSGYWQQEIDGNELPAGVYLLEVQIGQQRAYRRVVIE